MSKGFRALPSPVAAAMMPMTQPTSHVHEFRPKPIIVEPTGDCSLALVISGWVHDRLRQRARGNAGISGRWALFH